jgi:hypothetical protein
MDEFLVVIDEHATGEWGRLSANTVRTFQALDELSSQGRVAVKAVNGNARPVVFPDWFLDDMAARATPHGSMCGVHVQVDTPHSFHHFIGVGLPRIEQDKHVSGEGVRFRVRHPGKAA